MITLFGADGIAPAATDVAGNMFTVLVPPDPGLSYYTHLLTMEYTIGTSSHTITVLREMGRTTCPNGANGGQNIIVVATDPGNPLSGPKTTSHLPSDPAVAGDWIAIQLADGTYWFDQIAIVSGLTWTLNHNLPGSGLVVAAGNVVWWFGQIGDTNPLDPTTVYMKGSSGLAQANTQHPRFTVPAATSGTQEVYFGSIVAEHEVGILRSPVRGSPMLVQSNNSPAPAGTLQHLTFAYSDR